jgi:Calicivirus coat protein
MQRLHFRESTLVSASLLVAATLALGACSSSGGGSGNTQPATPATSPAAPTSAPASGEPTSGAGAVSAIDKNWATFFNAKTSTSRRLALLQDGDKLAAVIKAQSTNPLAATASAKVSHVTLTGTDQASVTYSILVSGQAVLSGQQGTAVYQDGVWKVGLASFCALLKLENAGKSSGLPAACKG